MRRAPCKASALRAASASPSWAMSAKSGCSAISPRSRSARSPTASIRRQRRPRSSTRCGTAALASSSPKTRNMSTRSCRWRIGCPICGRSSCSTIRRCSATRTRSCTALRICWPRRKSQTSPGSKTKSRDFHRPIPPSSSIRPARPAIRRARWSVTASILPRPTPSSRTIRRCARSRIAPSSICRCAMCSAATSPSRCR